LFIGYLDINERVHARNTGTENDMHLPVPRVNTGDGLKFQNNCGTNFLRT